MNYKIKEFINENPEEAECLEDLFNWTLDYAQEQGFVLSEYEEDEIFDYIKKNIDLPK